MQTATGDLIVISGVSFKIVKFHQTNRMDCVSRASQCTLRSRGRIFEETHGIRIGSRMLRMCKGNRLRRI